jgi:glutamine amidotransferase
MIAIIDYGLGNLFSLQNALSKLGYASVITADPSAIESADKVFLPGVGSFPAAMEHLNQLNLTDFLRSEAKKKPFMGICLGMQILYETGFEFGETAGLGLLPGCVRLMQPGDNLPVPHMGWNNLISAQQSHLFADLGGKYVYFVHSFAADVSDNDLYRVRYGEAQIPALVGDGKTVFGCQFHPEKSGDVGLSILKKFCEM